jgi:hypothetical protein
MRVTISSGDIVFANLIGQRTGVKSGRLTVIPDVSISVYDINTATPIVHDTQAGPVIGGFSFASHAGDLSYIAIPL